MAKPPTADAVERNKLSTMWLVFCPSKGIITTEPYEEQAMLRVVRLNDPCFVIEAASIQ